MSPTMSAESVDVLLDHFNLKILNVMEAVAPIRIKSTLSKQKKKHGETPLRSKTVKKRMQES